MRPHKQLFLLLLLLTSIYNCFSQSKRSAHWFFGDHAGLNFQGGILQADTTGSLLSIEGCASISDTLGNLLFYTNGELVWNKNHVLMSNGSGLFGSQTCVEGTIIAPMPGSDHLYYLFTTGYSFDVIADTPGIRFDYNIIDMNLNNGLGDVTAVKNVVVTDLAAEDISGTRHCNGTDYWIMIRRTLRDTIAFSAYLLTENGLSLTPVITKLPAPSSNFNSIGCTTFSQDGKKFVFSSFETGIYIFDFNTLTGGLTLKNLIPKLYQGLSDLYYSNVISPDNTKLYAVRWVYFTWNYLYQYDLTSTNVADSRVTIDSVDFSNPPVSNGYGLTGSMRLASNGKIYVSTFRELPGFLHTLDTLGVINSPNLPGLSCIYQRDGQYLIHRGTQYGLPNFISNFTTDVFNCTTVPLKLESFNVISRDCKALLNWKTGIEQSVRNIEVQKSANATEFTTVGSVDPKGSNSMYSLAIPNSINAFFRLKINDLDGYSEYSNVIGVKTGCNNISYLVIPNPSSNFIEISGLKNDDNVSILNLLGRKVLSFNSSQRYKFDIQQLVKGVYIVQIKNNDLITSNIKLIKN